MVKEIYPQVKRLLEVKKDRTNEQLYMLMVHLAGFKTKVEAYDAVVFGKVKFSFEGVTRTARKVREEHPHLRSEKSKKDKKITEPKVRAEINEFHTQKIQQGALL